MRDLEFTRDSQKLKICMKSKDHSRLHDKKLALFLNQGITNHRRMIQPVETARTFPALKGSSYIGRHRSLFRSHDSRRKASLTMKPRTEDRWHRLPDVVMDEIFSHLDHDDRINSSAVCWSWREAFYHPRFWKKITFTLSDPEKLSWAINLAERFGRSVEYVTVECHMPSNSELHGLLQHLRENHNLRQLCINPKLAAVTDGSIINFQPWTDPILRSILQIIQSSKQLEALTLGFMEELVASADTRVDLLAHHHGRHLTQLGLASVKRGQDTRHQAKQSRFTFERFRSIKYLTIDYDDLSDAVLESFTSGTLERLAVHVHEPSKDHPGTSNAAWQAFREKNKRCELHLTFIRAYTTISAAQDTILKPQMPLTHFTALFCENANMPLLSYLAISYKKTLKSFIWLDSVNREEFRPPTDHDREYENCIDFLESQCVKLEELTYIGQVYDNKYVEPVLNYSRKHSRGITTFATYIRFSRSDCLYFVDPLLRGLQKRLAIQYGGAVYNEMTKIIHDAMRTKTENSEELILSVLLREPKSKSWCLSTP